MGFKNMKRDDHGHVISNDETDGQECQHASGRAQEVEDQKYNKEMKQAQEQNAAMSEVFDDDYEEEFANYNKEPDARPNHTKLNDLNLSDSELWNMAYQYIGNDKLEKLAEQLDLDSPQDLTTNDMLKYMSDDDIADMMRVNGLDDEFDESQEKYEDFIGEDGQVKPDKREERDAFLERKDKEASKIITDAGMKDVNLTAALKLKNDYAEGKITKEELVDKYREHFKNDKNIVGSQGDKNEEQPTGEATSDDEWNKRHQEFLERGKSTWNQKLQKGDKITIQDKNGNDVDVYVNGFWKNGELVDEDTYEEGKDNHWHDFRGVGIADKDGKNLGSVNAYQIKKHSREPQEIPQENEMKSRYQKIREVLGDNADETIEWLFNHLSKLNSYKK